MKPLILAAFLISPLALADDDLFVTDVQSTEQVAEAPASATAQPPITEFEVEASVEKPEPATGLRQYCRMHLTKDYDELMTEIEMNWKASRAELRETRGSLLETDTLINLHKLEQLADAMRHMKQNAPLKRDEIEILSGFCSRILKSNR